MDLLGYENPPYHYIPQKTLNSDSFWIHALEHNYNMCLKSQKIFYLIIKVFAFGFVKSFSDHAISEYFPDKLKIILIWFILQLITIQKIFNIFLMS